MGCGPNGVVFPYFLARKYHPGGILAITRWFQYVEKLVSGRISTCVENILRTYVNPTIITPRGTSNVVNSAATTKLEQENGAFSHGEWPQKNQYQTQWHILM
jgi:hypothetical protein